jgi:hypothetical protein
MARRNIRCRKFNKESGVFLVLVLILVTVLTLLVAVVLGLGFLSTSKARLQNSTNLAALGAVEEFFRNEQGLSPGDRANAALNRARTVLSQNKLYGATSDATTGQIGLPSSVGEVSALPGGTLRFGTWHETAPTGGGDPCFGAYPCFEEQPSPTTWSPPAASYPVVNAVRLETKTISPILTPLRAFLGAAEQQLWINSNSTAAIVPRCTVFLLDASLSTTNDSHPSKIISQTQVPLSPPFVDGGPSLCSPLNVSRMYAPPYFYLCPREAELFAYNDWISFNRDVFPPMETDPRNDINNPCTSLGSYLYDANSVQPNFSVEGYMWCNMQWERLGAPGGPVPPPPSPKSNTTYPGGSTGRRDLCFEFEKTPYGRMLIDKCKDPEPLTSFLLGFNAGVRLLEKQRTAADRVRMSIFRGDPEVNPFPPTGFVTDPSVLVQLTNANYRGVIASPYPYNGTPTYVTNKQKIHPNFIDQGWFPIMQRGTSPERIKEMGSNVVGALESAIEALSDSAQCPAGAQKSIVLATDGVSTCVPGNSPLCSTSFSYFKQAEAALLNGETAINAKLKQKRIALTTILAGREIQPNIVNRSSNGAFLAFREAVAVGYRGLTDLGGGQYSGDSSTNGMLFVDSRAQVDDLACEAALGHVCSTEDDRSEFAFLNANPSNGTFFRRPNGIFAHLSIETGGIFCPLLPRGALSQYETDPNNPTGPKRLKDSERLPDAPLTISTSYVTPGDIAAECVRQTLGGNPFALVDN